MSKNEAVYLWAARCVSLVRPEISQTEHLDRLFGADYRPRHALADGLVAVGDLVEAIRPMRDGLLSLVVFPLEDSERLETRLPRVTEYRQQATAEPPILALVMRNSMGLWAREDTSYVEQILDLDLPLRLSAIYRCWRTAEGVANGWEFSRAIFVGDFDMAQIA